MTDQRITTVRVMWFGFIILLVFFATACADVYRPIASSSSPLELIAGVRQAYPGATLEHVEMYTPTNPWATDYPRWRGLVMEGDQIVAVAYMGAGNVRITSRKGGEVVYRSDSGRFSDRPLQPPALPASP